MATPTGPRRHVKFDRKPGAPGHSSSPPAPASSGGTRTPDLHISGTNHRSESRSRVLFLVGLVAVAGTVAAAVVLNADKDDPHYVKARNSVQAYEQGKPVERRNYTNPLYQSALDDLARVDPESISADPAKALADTIRLGIKDFEARQQSRQRSVSTETKKRQTRRRAIVDGILRERANPQTDYPECEDEESDGHDHPDS